MSRLVLLLGLVTAALSASACKPEIGDECKLSTDCSITGDRLCDTSQPDGYCTIFNCTAGGCPSEAVCVSFHAAKTGDRFGESRFDRRFCVRHCDANSDCRPGYVCVDPADPRAGREGRIEEGDPHPARVCLP
jgi:hypothetical protein